VKDRHAHVQQLAPAHRVTMLCALLDLSRSGYYDWRGGPGPRQKEDARLSPEVEAVFVAKRRTYERIRLTRELRARGHACGERRVARLMRAQDLQARPRRAFRPQTTDSRHDGPIAPHRLAERPAAPSRPNEVWVTDFTSIPTRASWLFLAVVLDLYRRRVVGWAFGLQLTATLARAALQMALQHRQPPAGGECRRRKRAERGGDQHGAGDGGRGVRICCSPCPSPARRAGEGFCLSCGGPESDWFRPLCTDGMVAARVWPVPKSERCPAGKASSTRRCISSLAV
jgi:hypothetical protein